MWSALSPSTAHEGAVPPLGAAGPSKSITACLPERNFFMTLSVMTNDESEVKRIKDELHQVGREQGREQNGGMHSCDDETEDALVVVCVVPLTSQKLALCNTVVLSPQLASRAVPGEGNQEVYTFIILAKNQRTPRSAYPALRPGGPTEEEFKADDQETRQWLRGYGRPEAEIAEKIAAQRRGGALEEERRRGRPLEAAKAAVEHQYGLRVNNGSTGPGGAQATLWKSGQYMIKILEDEFSRGGPHYTPTHIIYTAEGLSRCPQICHYYDSFTIEGRTVMIMEYIDGESDKVRQAERSLKCKEEGGQTTVCLASQSFREKNDFRGMEEAAAKVYFMGVFTALGYLHARGVYYYDVKGNNFMVCAGGG
ncbi:unnamed protein product [Vitrella brassicaformis CCMP3155]|uniref:Protein kinase domain-containing protein n=1 Tax=Vitrella brassicaformis (strain CCMP3155) TaxID=1169540 RepID=A0A0G4EWX3_VITBC|nr:unnamed protein product [Vitrella brassicaformis CCMP3155]|eukprot:CEM03492.1 unnamed protein product [Vitrella brassicaformis CCMP3155]